MTAAGAATRIKPLTAFRYISFDVVGTLIDYESAITDGMARIAAEVGKKLDGEEVLRAYARSRTKPPKGGRCPDDLGRCYSIMAKEFNLPDDEAKQKFMIEAVAESKPFPDSVEALTRLKKHYKLIAMTNAQRWGFERYEKKLGNPFWATFTTDDTGVEKPDPKFFRDVFAFVQSKGGSKDDMLHTAQSQYHDMGVAREFGMTICWIERRFAQPGSGGTLPSSFTKPDYHYRSMLELADAADKAFGG